MEGDLVPERDATWGAKRERKFRIAMGLYGVLAVLIWFTFGDGTVLVPGGRIETRWIPLFIVALFGFRTYVAHQAEKIRRLGADGRE